MNKRQRIQRLGWGGDEKHKIHAAASSGHPFYNPQCSCGKVMFLHLSVSHSVHRGGQTPPLLGRHPVGRPPGRPPPSTTSRRLLLRTVRILLKCILVIIYFYIARFPPDKTTLLRETDFGYITKAILPQRMNRVRIGTITSSSSVIFSH